MSVIVTVEVCS